PEGPRRKVRDALRALRQHGLLDHPDRARASRRDGTPSRGAAGDDDRLRRRLLVGCESHQVGIRVTRAEYIAGLRRTLEWPELDEDTELAGAEHWDSLAQVDAVMYTQDALGHTL